MASGPVNHVRAGGMRACAEASASMGRRGRGKTKTSLAANRTGESRPSGMRGGLAETWAIGELGTHLAIERASVGNSPPKVIRAALLPDGDGFQLMLRFSFQPRLTPSVIAPR